MAGGYDGSIKIDTRINETGFNKGIAKVGNALTGMMSKIVTGLAVFSLVAIGVVAAVVSIASALIAAGVVAFKFLEKITADMYKALSPASAYYDQVSVLKTAFDALNGSVQAMFSSLLTAAAPILMKVIDWLIKIINLVSMIIAALSGQKTYMKYISGAAQQSARSTGKAAKNTEKMTKAVKGAVAAWDELNVLQMEQANQDTGGGASGGNIMFQETPIESGILKTIDKIKKWFVDAWTFIKTKFLDAAAWIEENIVGPIWDWFIVASEWIKQAAIDTWNWIVQAIADAGEWIITAWENVKLWFATAWQNISKFASDAWEWIVAIWNGAVDWFNVKVLIPLISWFSKAWEDIKSFPARAWEKIKEIWQTVKTWFDEQVIQPVSDFFSGMWEDIKTWGVNAWEDIKKTWETVKTWFDENIITPLETAWTTFTDWLKETWDTVWNGEGGVKSLAKGAINGIITFINAMIRALATGINTIITALNKIKITIPNLPIFGDMAGKEWGFNLQAVSAPQIPLLAQGAVIPPNAKFAAILGDQKSGRNLEAPEGLIRQIIREEMENMGGDLNVTMPVYLDSEKIYEGQQQVNRRRGKSLAFGGAS